MFAVDFFKLQMYLCLAGLFAGKFCGCVKIILFEDQPAHSAP